ncbi:hypothetical protein PENTCL1PPCAC_18517, partial [Pristionchus entomophagus]
MFRFKFPYPDRYQSRYQSPLPDPTLLLDPLPSLSLLLLSSLRDPIPFLLRFPFLNPSLYLNHSPFLNLQLLQLLSLLHLLQPMDSRPELPLLMPSHRLLRSNPKLTNFSPVVAQQQVVQVPYQSLTTSLSPSLVRFKFLILYQYLDQCPSISRNPTPSLNPFPIMFRFKFPYPDRYQSRYQSPLPDPTLLLDPFPSLSLLLLSSLRDPIPFLLRFPFLNPSLYLNHSPFLNLQLLQLLSLLHLLQTMDSRPELPLLMPSLRGLHLPMLSLLE